MTYQDHISRLSAEEAQEIDPCVYYDDIRSPRVIEIDPEAIDGWSANEKVGTLSLMIRDRTVNQHLLASVLSDAVAPITSRTPKAAAIEYCWLLYSQRRWAPLLLRCKETATLFPLSERQAAHLADLQFLALARLSTRAIQEGKSRNALEHINAEMIWAPAGRRRVYDNLLRFIGKDDDAAWDALAATEISPRLTTTLKSVESMYSEPFINRFKTERAPLSISPAKGADKAILVSTDQGYFERYAQGFLNSLSAVDPSFAVHVHCIGFTMPDAFKKYANIKGITLSWTEDGFERGEHRLDYAKGYFAGARYLFLPDYLEVYGEVYVADIDALARRPISTCNPSGADVALDTWELREGRVLQRFPWEVITANNFLIKGTPAGIQYASAVSDYIGVALLKAREKDHQVFCSDQLALYFAYRKLRENWAGRFGVLQPSFDIPYDWRMFQGENSKMEFVAGHIANP